MWIAAHGVARYQWRIKVAKHRKLKGKEKEFLAESIAKWVPIARCDAHPFRIMARREIRMLFWRWTADGVDVKTGAVMPDSLKYSEKFQLFSKKASKALHSRKGRKPLRHEHAVPRETLADHIIKQQMRVDEIVKFLNKFCRAVVVTHREHKKLGHQRKEAWGFKTGNAFVRYRDAFGRDWRTTFLCSRK